VCLIQSFKEIPLKNIKTKQQLINLIRSTPIKEIVTTNKPNQINKFTKESTDYILIKTASNQGVIK